MCRYLYSFWSHTCKAADKLRDAKDWISSIFQISLDSLIGRVKCVRDGVTRLCLCTASSSTYICYFPRERLIAGTRARGAAELAARKLQCKPMLLARGRFGNKHTADSWKHYCRPYLIIAVGENSYSARDPRSRSTSPDTVLSS